MKHKYNYVICLDGNMDVAIQRNRQYKEKVSGLLDLKEGMRILDIGCGVGRWGEMFCKHGLYYVGLDGSSGMIEKAEENLYDYDDKKLIVGNLLNIKEILRNTGEIKEFDIVFICGVMMYLNDIDVQKIFDDIVDLTNAESQICIIESMADEERLTLDNFYSEDLKSNYSAIYRSVPEYMKMMDKSFSDKFKMMYDERMNFEDGLQKKREHVTIEHCVIWRTR